MVRHSHKRRRFTTSPVYPFTDYAAQGETIPEVTVNIQNSASPPSIHQSSQPPPPSPMPPNHNTLISYPPNMPPRPATWIQILDRPPICHELFAYLSPASLFRFARTCKWARDAATMYCKTAFDIDVILHRFFLHPLAFRALQASTGTLISGSTALQLLNRTQYRSSDLDLYTHPGYAKEIGLWLVRCNNYHYVTHRGGVQIPFNDVQCIEWSPSRTTSPQSDDDDGEYPYSGLHDVYCFQKTSADGKVVRVQIMSSYNTLMECFMAFHSSTSRYYISHRTLEHLCAACVMNFIAFDAAYSLYPRATFEQHLNLALTIDSYNDQRCVAKYARRGWRTAGNFWPQDEYTTALFSINEQRFVSDDLCWKLNLDVKRLPRKPRLSPRSEAFPWDPASITSWTLHTTTCSPWKVAPKFMLVKTPVFRFTYMCATDTMRDTLSTFGNQQGLLQWRRVDERETRVTMPADWSWYVSPCVRFRTTIDHSRWDSMVPVILDSIR